MRPCPEAEMIYCYISKEMSSLYFGRYVFCSFELELQNLPWCTLPQCPSISVGKVPCPIKKTLASNR